MKPLTLAALFALALALAGCVAPIDPLAPLQQITKMKGLLK